MTIFKPGLRWLIIGLLALLAFGVLAPGTANAQEPSQTNCGDGAVPVGETWTRIDTNIKPPNLALVEQAVMQGGRDRGLGGVIIQKLYPAATVKRPANVAAAIAEVNAAYVANGMQKLNVLIDGHSDGPGTQTIGGPFIPPGEVIGIGANKAKLQEFIDGTVGKIEHLILLGCETGQGHEGQKFVNQLQSGLGAVLVKTWTNTVGKAQAPNAFYVLDPGVKKDANGAQGQCFSKRTDTLPPPQPPLGKLWHVVECSPGAFMWSRVDAFVSTQKGYPTTDVHFICLANPTLKAVGVRKGPIRYQVQPPPFSDEEQWSGSFPNNKCPGSVAIYLQPPPLENPPKQLQEIKKVLFSNPVGGIIVDEDTGALSLQSDSSSGSDAWLLTAVIGGTAAAAVTLGGGVWYARRRRAQ